MPTQVEIDAKVRIFLEDALKHRPTIVRYAKQVVLCYDTSPRLPFEAQVYVNGDVAFSQKCKYHTQAVAACDSFVHDMMAARPKGTRFINVKGRDV